MRMRKPIITTDLAFARGLCGNAALYYESINAQVAVDRILQLVDNNELQQELVTNGIKELEKFDSSSMRAAKVIQMCENNR